MSFTLLSLTVAGSIVVGSALFPSSPNFPNKSTNLDKKVADAASHYMDTCEAMGWSGTVLIERKGNIILHEGYGLAQRDKGIPCGTGTLFEIASATKPFTACAVMLLVEDGIIDLDDSIAKHLPGVPEDKEGITVEHLLAHTSGMPGSAGGMGGETLEEAVANYLIAKAGRLPGEAHEYWNGGYALLAAIVESVSGMAYPEFCKKRIFKPAGMQASGFAGDALPIEDQSFGYADRGGRLAAGHAYQDSYGWQYRGMGGLVTTAEDLLAFTKAFTKGKVVRKKTVGDMWKTRSEFYGLGWGIAKNTPTGGRRIGHGGDVAGFHTSFQHFPDDDATIIVLTNLDGAPIWKFGWDLEAIVFGKEPKNIKRPDITQISTKRQKSITGTYESETGQHIEIAAHGPGLTLAYFDRDGVASSLNPKAKQDAALFETMFEAMIQSDGETLRKSIAKRVPSSWGPLIANKLWPARIEALGPLVSHEVVEIKHAAAKKYTSIWIKLHHRDGEAWLQAGLESGRLGYLQLEPKTDPTLQPLVAYLLPTSDKEFQGYDGVGSPSGFELTTTTKGKKTVAIQVQPSDQESIVFERVEK